MGEKHPADASTAQQNRSSSYPAAASPGRSRNMRANRRVDTKPEREIRSALHRRGYRFRKDYRLEFDTVRVRPDIVFTAKRVAVFVDGCFWHACPIHSRSPAVNQWYWSPKLQRNVERDRRADRILADAGWKVVRIWEHEAIDAAVDRVMEILENEGNKNA
ncbi:very short patch repair endonuclease [Rhodococcus coprophilus]|uniref:very short patch repair endonuclease n=1 Tax=Rhodococcus coprophilus TaxID=38310 RepID=UPI0037B4C131